MWGGDFIFSGEEEEDKIRRLIKTYSFLIPVRKLWSIDGITKPWRIMGCNCTKGTRLNNDNVDNNDTIINNVNVKESRSKPKKTPKKKKKSKSASSSKDNNVGSEETSSDNKEASLTLLIPIDAKNNEEPEKKVTLERKSSRLVFQRRPTGIELGPNNIGTLQQPKMTRISSVSNGERGAQVMAGWPSWLASVAGEAINGWIPRKADSFEKLEKVRPFVSYNFDMIFD